MLLDFIAYFVIPIYTIVFAAKDNFITSNLSVISNTMDRQAMFVIWGIIMVFYFSLSLLKIIEKTALVHKKILKSLLYTDCLLLLAAVSTPYLPDIVPFKSFLHIVFAFVAAVMLLAILYLIIVQLYTTDKVHFKSFLQVLIGTTIISAILLMVIGIVSSLLEIYFTISTVLLIRKLLKTIEENND